MPEFDLILMFSSGLEICSIFKIHHSVYCCHIHVLFNLTESTSVNHRFGRSSSSSCWQTPSSRVKVSWHWKKNYLKNRQLFYNCNDLSNIKVLNSFIFILRKFIRNVFLIKSKVKFLNCTPRVARKFGEFRSNILNKKITIRGCACDTFIY